MEYVIGINYVVNIKVVFFFCVSRIIFKGCIIVMYFFIVINIMFRIDIKYDRSFM